MKSANNIAFDKTLELLGARCHELKEYKTEFKRLMRENDRLRKRINGRTWIQSDIMRARGCTQECPF